MLTKTVNNVIEIAIINNGFAKMQNTCKAINTYEFYLDPISLTVKFVSNTGSSLCSDGFKLNGRCYKGSSETLSWFGARNRCLDGGGDLASFEFIVDTQGFGALNGSGWNQPTTYWVGLQRMKWTWKYSSKHDH